MSAQDRGWGPPIRPGDPRLVVVEAGGIRLRLHREVAPLFAAFIRDIVGRGYDLDDVADDWGHAYRLIRGSATQWSNHAWGLAADLNATRNPMASRLITDMPSWVDEVAASYGLSWGGNYSRRKDAMHFEFLGTPQDAARRVAALRARPSAPAGTVRLPVTGDALQAGDRGEQVRQLQRLLAAAGFPPGAVDGEYGARTREAVARFQRARGLVVDGVAGPVTLRALRTPASAPPQTTPRPRPRPPAPARPDSTAPTLEGKQMYLVQAEGDTRVWVTDGITRKHVTRDGARVARQRIHKATTGRDLPVVVLESDDDFWADTPIAT